MPRTKAQDNGHEEEEDRTIPYRFSFAVDQALRRNIRIAAAHADKTNGEWILEVIRRAAEKAVSR